MRFLYKNATGQVFEYESHAAREQYGSPDLVQMTEAELDAHLNPPPLIPTYQEELALLNKQYQEDVEAFNKAFSLAIMFDGVTEEAKKATIREQYAARKNKYVADLDILRIKHGV